MHRLFNQNYTNKLWFLVKTCLTSTIHIGYFHEYIIHGNKVYNTERLGRWQHRNFQAKPKGLNCYNMGWPHKHTCLWVSSEENLPSLMFPLPTTPPRGERMMSGCHSPNASYGSSSHQLKYVQYIYMAITALTALPPSTDSSFRQCQCQY